MHSLNIDWHEGSKNILSLLCQFHEHKAMANHNNIHWYVTTFQRDTNTHMLFVRINIYCQGILSPAYIFVYGEINFSDYNRFIWL